MAYSILINAYFCPQLFVMLEGGLFSTCNCLCYKLQPPTDLHAKYGHLVLELVNPIPRWRCVQENIGKLEWEMDSYNDQYAGTREKLVMKPGFLTQHASTNW